MTEDEIRKLLGGYATDALSADERRILFQAALEDQELFNALQNEDALKHLLADPVTRGQVRRALETPVARRKEFHWRRWLIRVAIPAVVAVIVIVVMNRANAPRLIAPPAQVASNSVAAPAPAPEALESPARPAPTRKQFLRPPTLNGAKPAAALPQLAITSPAAPQPAPAAATRANLRVAEPSGIPEAIQQQFAAGVATNASLYQGPLVRYSLLRSGLAGDAVRVEVSTGVAGYLALYRINADGSTQRVYPANGPTVLVQANRAIQIPESPLKIADAGVKLRLVVVPANPPAAIGQLATGQGGVAGGAVNGAVTLGTGNVPNQAQPAPMIVDIPLASN